MEHVVASLLVNPWDIDPQNGAGDRSAKDDVTMVPPSNARRGQLVSPGQGEEGQALLHMHRSHGP